MMFLVEGTDELIRFLQVEVKVRARSNICVSYCCNGKTPMLKSEQQLNNCLDAKLQSQDQRSGIILESFEEHCRRPS